MDLNLNLVPPLCPAPLSVDLGYDLALDALPLDIEDDDVSTRLPPIDSLLSLDDIPEPENLFEPFDLPSYTDISPIPIPSVDTRNNALNSVPYSASVIFDNEPLAQTGGPRLQRELFECPELRFQRLIESRDWWEIARTRSSGDDSSACSATDPERLMRDIRRSGRQVGYIGKHKADEAPLAEGSAEEKNENIGGGTDFDCNVCLESAKDPVVTSCGHLFCWPCLYQWLSVHCDRKECPFVHCDHKECPVCKGNVNESNVVPIYGRGSSEPSGKKKDGGDAHMRFNIPPRPRGNRVESLRRQFRGPLFRTSAIIHGVNELISHLPDAPVEPNRGRTSMVLADAPVEPNRGRTSMVLADAPVEPNRGRTSMALPDAPVEPNRGRTSMVLADAPVEPNRGRTSLVLPDAPVEPNRGRTSMVLADAPVESNRGRTSMVLRSRAISRTTSNSSDVNGRARERRRMN